MLFRFERHQGASYGAAAVPSKTTCRQTLTIPDGPERTRGFAEHYFGPEVTADWAEDMMAFNAQVGAEDDRLTDSVQRGLRAGIPDQGRFLVNSEHLIVHFQKLVLAALA